MLSKENSTTFADELITFLCLLVLLMKLGFIVTILILLVLVSLIIIILNLELLMRSLTDHKNFLMNYSYNNYVITFLIGLLILYSIQNIIFFYLNYLIGFLYSIILFIIMIIILQEFISNDITSKVNFLLLKFLFLIYSTVVVYSILFNMTLLQFDSSSLFKFIFNVIFKEKFLLYKILEDILLVSGSLEFIINQIATLVIIIMFNNIIITKLFSYIVKMTEFAYKEENQNTLPLLSENIFFIGITSILLITNGLEILLDIILNIILLSSIILFILERKKNISSNLSNTKVRLLHWLLTIVFLRYGYYFVISLHPIIELTYNLHIDMTIMTILLYLGLSIIFLFGIKLTLQFFSFEQQSKIFLYINFFLLPILLFKTGNTLLNFILMSTSILIVLYCDKNFIHIKNSINLNYRNIIQITSKISLLSLSYLLI